MAHPSVRAHPSTQAAFSPAQAEFLLSHRGREALARLTEADLAPQNRLRLVERLRDDFDPAQVDALIRQAELRLRARAKFPHADRLYFTPQALEQATAWEIGVQRAAWIHRRAPAGPILDLGCGIGGDTLALARLRPVIAYEQDPVRLRFAQANAQTLGLDDRIDFRLADWTQELAAGRLPQAAAAFVDPSRRRGTRRIFRPEEMQPPLSALLALRDHTPGLAVKMAPGVPVEAIPAPCGVTFISHQGVCKEALLAFPPLDTPGARRAWVHTRGSWHELTATDEPSPVGPLQPGMVLHEPDPAVIRAGAFPALCRLLDAHLVDPTLAYLAGPRPAQGTPAEPFVCSFQVEEIHPFHLKALNRRLQALGIGQVELKKRGAPFAPESLRTRLRLTPGGRAAVIFFTRLEGRPLMLLARRLPD